MIGTKSAMIKNEILYPPHGPSTYPMPEAQPIRTGRPISPSKNQIRLIKKDSRREKVNATNMTTKFSAVMWEPFGKGMLI